MDFKKTRSIVSAAWDASIVPTIRRYIEIPNQSPLFDPDWQEEEKPWVLGRKRFGNIAIANSDAGAVAYTDAAIDQAFRAVGELMASNS